MKMHLIPNKTFKFQEQRLFFPFLSLRINVKTFDGKEEYGYIFIWKIYQEISGNMKLAKLIWNIQNKINGRFLIPVTLNDGLDFQGLYLLEFCESGGNKIRNRLIDPLQTDAMFWA